MCSQGPQKVVRTNRHGLRVVRVPPNLATNRRKCELFRRNRGGGDQRKANRDRRLADIQRLAGRVDLCET
jgi:hypothetical protein